MRIVGHLHLPWVVFAREVVIADSTARKLAHPLLQISPSQAEAADLSGMYYSAQEFDSTIESIRSDISWLAARSNSLTTFH